MQWLKKLASSYEELHLDIVSIGGWDLFVKALAVAFIAYWLHLGHGLNDWLGSLGFHLVTPASKVFQPLSPPFPQILWWITLSGALLLFSSRTQAFGCFIAGVGFFYATCCDLASTGALNMHFLFALVVIFWSTSLKRIDAARLSAWPIYLIRIYLVVVYFGSGWRKVIYGNWLNNPDALIQCMSGFYVTNLSRHLYFLMPLHSWALAQYATLAFELGAPLWLLYPPFRRGGAIAGCLLHIGIGFLMKDLLYFSLLMVTFYIPILLTVHHSAGNSALKHSEQGTAITRPIRLMVRRIAPLLFLLLWILPVAWVGFMRSNFPIYPAWIAPLFRVSGVFESSPETWRIFFIEDHNENGWHELNETTLFAHTPLGNRTRFQPLMSEIASKSPEQASDILKWIAANVNKALPHFPQTRAAVRIVYFIIPYKTFFNRENLHAVYEDARKEGTPYVVVTNSNLLLPDHETP